MWPNMPETMRLFLSIALVGVAVKFLDDYMDDAADRLMSKFNWARFLGKGIFSYGLLALALALWIHPRPAFSLFLASYAMGMGSIWQAKMPSTLRGYQESFIILLLGIVLTGPVDMVLAVANIYFLLVFDDWRDACEDFAVSAANLWRLLGPPLALASVVMVLIISSLINPWQTLIVIVLAGIYYFLESLLELRYLHRGEE